MILHEKSWAKHFRKVITKEANILNLKSAPYWMPEGLLDNAECMERDFTIKHSLNS